MLSLSIHHTGERVHCMVDGRTKQAIESATPVISLEIVWHVELDKYSHLNRREMEVQGVWSEFQMKKAEVIHRALESEDDTLFLDADILVLGAIAPTLTKQSNSGYLPTI